MRRILEQIEKHRAELPSQPLFKFLSDEDVDGATRLSFTPSMLYYLMGFKDVLRLLERPDSDEKLHRYINAYCGEDADHWRWYLTDLGKLGYELTTWGEELPGFAVDVWSESTRANRDTIFHLVGHAEKVPSPLAALTLISVFEATGVVFIGHTRKAAIALGMDEELQYFGREHYEEEFGHSVQARPEFLREEASGGPAAKVQVWDRFGRLRQRLSHDYHDDRNEPVTERAVFGWEDGAQAFLQRLNEWSVLHQGEDWLDDVARVFHLVCRC